MSEIKINVDKKLIKISPVLYGIFFEDINYAGDGGLYAELIANRSFSYYSENNDESRHKTSWDGDFEIKSEASLNGVNKYYAEIRGIGSKIKNKGFCGEGFFIKKNESFDFTLYAKGTAELIIRISDENANSIVEENMIVNDVWNEYKTKVQTNNYNGRAYLSIIIKNGEYADIAFVSLFPKDTFNGRKNGMRNDLGNMIKDLSPKFMRFPGGCIVEGRSFGSMYNWKDTIGPVTERKTNINRWQMDEYQQEGRNSEDYFQSYGIGFYEYFLFCEDIGAKPVPVVNAGMTCQWHEGLLVDLDKLEPFIQDTIDLIEFANGDESSEWGLKRIHMGHKEPFNLEYIGIGNEQWGDVYFERYERFYEVISRKYPYIKLIASAGWDSEGRDFDYAYKWFAENKEKAFAVDEHFYKSPRWFLDNEHRYDNYDRSLPKVFAGEYAAHSTHNVSERKNNWECAMAEAVFLMGVEKNSDHIVMSCYAPLLARENHQQWQPDMIWFNSEKAYATPSYYVQKLFSENIGDYIVEHQCDDEEIKLSVSADKDNIYIKAVNMTDKEKDIKLNINKKVNLCEVYTIGAELSDVNTMDNIKVYPIKSEIDRPEYKMKKYSIAVFKLGV